MFLNIDKGYILKLFKLLLLVINSLLLLLLMLLLLLLLLLITVHTVVLKCDKCFIKFLLLKSNINFENIYGLSRLIS